MKGSIILLFLSAISSLPLLAQAPSSIAGQSLRTAYATPLPQEFQLDFDFAANGTYSERVDMIATGVGGAFVYQAPAAGTYTYNVTGANTATLVLTSQGANTTEALTFSSATQGTWPGGFAIGTTNPAQFSLLPTGGLPANRALINMSVLITAAQNQPTSFGFVVGGNAPYREVLIRAVGPSLSQYGVTNAAANPTYQLNNPKGTLTLGPGSGANGMSWGATSASAAVIAAEDAQSGAFPLTQGSTDKADVYLLAPGNYTITVNPTNASQAGNVLVEVYEVE